MEFNEQINCTTCKYGYFDGFSWDGWHNLCGVGNCYLCKQHCEFCADYEEGKIPDGKQPIQ